MSQQRFLFVLVCLAGCGTDVVLEPLPPPSDPSPRSFQFVVAADSHVPSPGGSWDAGDIDRAVADAVASTASPAFFTVLGDLTAGAEPQEFDRIESAVLQTGVTWMPVPGNHDFFDGGHEYTRRYGDGNYSFDIEDVHFIVENSNYSDAQQLAFIQADLAAPRTSRDVVVMCHHSPSDDLAAAMSDAGVTYLLTGHWHADRALRRAGLTEIGIAPFLMGGIDGSAAGYRVFTYRDGVLDSSRRETVTDDDLEVIWPRSTGCIPTVDKLIVAATGGATDRQISYRIDDGQARPLRWVGGWDYSADIPPVETGPHSLDIVEENRPLVSQTFSLCDSAVPFALDGDWKQTGGTAEHRNSAPVDLEPPLVPRWTATVGGRLNGGSVVVKGDVAIVVTADAPSSEGSRLVALSLATGAELWSRTFDVPLVGAAAIVDERAIVTTKNGDVLGVGLTDGATLWTYSAAQRMSSFDATTWSAPALVDNLAFVSMANQLVVLSTTDGAVLWSFRPHDIDFHWLATLASPTITDDLVATVFDRTAGLVVASSESSDAVWSIDDESASAVNASPVVEQGIVYVLNAAGRLTARQLTDGQVVFTKWLTRGTSDWDYATVSTPAVSERRIFVSTQRDYLYALDASDGSLLWRAAGRSGPITVAHYESRQSGWASPPLLLGDTLYVGSLDGELIAVDAATGDRKWGTKLGAPITSSITPVTGGVLVSTYDGSVHLLTHQE